MKKSSLTEDKAEQTPTGGVLVGKRQGQTIIHNKGTLSGYLVGKTHAEGGIKAINKSTGQPLEMQGGEVVITAPAVSDNTKNEFNGKMMTNREVLSAINEKGGGVSFAKGGDIPKNIKRTGASYKYGGKTMTDHEIYKHITGGHLAEGMTLSKIAKMHKVSVKELQKQVDLGMKAESEHTSSKREQMKIVKDHLYENPKYYTLLKKVGLKKGGSFENGGANEIGGTFNIKNQFDSFTTIKVMPIDENLRVSKDFFSVKITVRAKSGNDIKIQEKPLVTYPISKYDSFMEDLNKRNPTKLKKGGEVESLVKDAKSGNTPARDLNNYNDVLDIDADGVVGAETGLYGFGGRVSNSKLFIPSVRGGWTKEKIIKYLKSHSSDTISTLTLLKYISEFDNWEELKNHIYYHGTQSYIQKGLKPSITMSEREVERIGGGGYGERYFGVSLTKRKKTAESFSGMSNGVSIYPVILKRDAKVIERPDLQDASEIEDIIVELYEKNVDAVYIGGGEEELVVINPFSILLYKNGKEYHSVFGGFKSIPLTDEKIKEIYNKSKVLSDKYSEEYNSKQNKDEREQFLKSIPNIQFDKGGSVKETGLYAKGGKVKTYDDGGSVKEEVEYITIGNQSSNPYIHLEKVKFYNFIDFKIFIKDLYAESGATNKREVFLCINRDDSTAKFGVSVSQGKNTNSNFNPFTGTFKDLEKNLQKFSVGNFDLFDWNRWGGVKTAKTTASKTSKLIVPDANSVIAIMIYNDNKVFIDGADTIYKLLDILSQAQKDGITRFYRKYIFEDSNIYQADYISWIENNPSVTGDINPSATSPIELKKWLRKQTDLNSKPFNLDYFFSKSASATSTPIATATATTSGLYKASEIKLFQEIDEIIKKYNLQPLETPIIEWSRAGKYNDFTLTDDETGEVFKLRSYNDILGVREEDVNKDRAKGLLKIYINWKATQSSGSATPINAKNTIEVSRLSRNDLSNVKIWLGNNPELSEKIQKRAFELGLKWVDGDSRVSELDAPCLIFNGRGNQDNRIEKRASKSLFDNVNLEEIFVTDSTTTATPTSLPIDLTKTKIWIGDNPALSEKIQKRAMELGWDWWSGDGTPKFLDYTNLFFDINNKITSASDETNFDSFKDFREIDEADLFGTFTTPTSNASQTSKQNTSTEDEDWVKKFTADLDKLVTYLPNDMDFAPELSKERKDLNALIQLLPSFQQSKYAIERAKILKEIKKLHYKLTYEGFIKPNEALSSDADLFTPQGLLDYYFTQATQNPTAELEPACELITPNGEKSKLPMSAYLNVRTEQFKNWFGDWEKAYETGNYVNCSKMIDPDTKEPKIYFHGVRKFVPNFGQFSNMGQGVVRPYGAFEPPSFPASYFAGDEDYAKFYGGVAENLPTPSADYKPFIYKVFLSVKNPISLLPLDFMLSYKDFMDYIYVGYGVKVEPNQELLKVLNNDITKKNPMWIYVRRDIGFIEKLKDYGYDAIFQMGDIPTFLPNGEVEPDRTKHLQEVEYLTFYPNQVKSATVKKSFYFDFFNDIRFKNGGYVRI